MEPAIDPFTPLLKLLDRYRRDVNQLGAPASEEAIRATERHLGHRLPITLAGFLRRWNGGSLFRGALQLRGTSELANPSESCPSLVAFADMPSGRQWAYAPDGQGDFVFGEVVGDRLRPLHDRFDRWLNGAIRVLDEDARDPDRELELRLDCDPECGWLLLYDGERATGRGDPDRATKLYLQATAADPSNIRAWQRLGESQLADGDRGQARFSLLRALRATRLPTPFPGAEVVEPGVLRTLASLFPTADAGWERELRMLLDERIADVRTVEGANLYQAANLEIARLMLGHGARREARAVLARAAERARSFAWREPMVELLLQLAALETDLGEHDDAERSLRPLVGSSDPRVRGRALLALARVVVTRQEPWAEEILDEAREGLEDHADLAHWHLLWGERHLLLERYEKSEKSWRQADTHAMKAGQPALQGLVCIGLGDIDRARGEVSAAAEAYNAARKRAEEAGDQELALRVVLRQGDLALRAGRAAEALDAFSRAAEGYAQLDLPVREGWARLRVVRAGGVDSLLGQQAIRRAREIFAHPSLQLAAGIGALDALTGDPARSLGWHLSCASAHARDRAEAQRARPPLSRADADRPERRLGAHRVAVAAGNLRVVEALSLELERLCRELGSAAGRASDPKVSSYIAASDLLASHRSFEAAQVLLRQLLEQNLTEVPARALKGAVTRSPNGALADGLLAAIEQPKEPRATAASAEVLGWRRERAAVPALRALLSSARSNPVKRAAAVALGRIGDREAADDLLDVLEIPELAEDVAVALLLLGDRRGVDFHGQALASGRELANSPGEIVGRYGGPAYLLLLLSAAAEESAGRAMGALQGLGYLGHARGVPRLLEALSHRDRPRVAVASGALEMITGHREDPEEPGVHARWERWWEAHADEFTEGVRYREGKPLGPRGLVEKLADDDPLVRRGAFDELVITTGCALPFDAEGPWRVQVAHQREWRLWCRANAESYPPGGWWFHGERIG